MKKTILTAILFLVVFAAVYLALCFLVPGLRIKLAAPPMEYFFTSLGHMVFFKALISALVSIAAAAIPWLIPRKSA